MVLTKNEHGYYEARIKTTDGKRRSISTHKRNRKEAEEFISKAKVKELELAAEMGVFTPAVIAALTGGVRTTIEEAIEPWKVWMGTQRFSPSTIENYEMWVRAWAASPCMAKIGGLRSQLMRITEEHLDPWVNNQASRSNLGTRQLMLYAIRSFFRFVSARGWCMGNPSELVAVDPFPLLHSQKEPRRQPVFTDEEVDLLLLLTSEQGEKPSPFWHAAIAISRWTGLRLGDIASLEWACLAVPNRISVWTIKRDRRVELPLEPSALKEAFLSIPRHHHLFLFPEQREIVRDPKRRSLLSVQFGKLCRACSIFGKSFHGLRATCATDMDQRGIPIEDIAAVLGHLYTSTTAGYIRPT